jgi:hypothetical protein
MAEYWTVTAGMYFFDDKITTEIETQFDNRPDAEQFAVDVDMHRHSVEKFPDIEVTEKELNAYFVPEGQVVLKAHTVELITTYEGLKIH